MLGVKLACAVSCAMKQRLWWSLVVAGSAGCGADPYTKPQLPPGPAAVAPSASVATVTSAALASTATAAAPRPAPASGRERLAFAVPIRNGEGTIAVELDVPASWGIEPNEYFGPSFKSCRSSKDILGTSLARIIHERSVAVAC
jgi:hypothetical protein